MVRTATCCCRQSSIEVEGEPKIHVVCHCNNCKKRTGSAFGISAYFSDTQVRNKQGKTEIYEINTTPQQERHFCALCGTTLYWKVSSYAGMTGIAGGCFADNPLSEPTLTVSNEWKCAWVKLPDGWKTSIQPGELGNGNA